MWGKDNPCILLVGKQTVAATVEIYTELSLKKKATIFPSYATSRSKPKETKSMTYQRDTFTSMFILVPFTIARKWICHSCSGVEKMDKENEVHIHDGI